MNWLKAQPVEVRQEFIAKCEGIGFRKDAKVELAGCLDRPA